MTDGPSSGGGSSSLRLWGAIVAIALVAIFMLQNSQQETVDFFFWDITAPLILSLLFAALLGFAIGFGLSRFRGDK
ncbi:MAG: LapA family protein [Actinomycetota bacterium]|nr:LapA family protein [Actinomycetota bacterium]